MANAARSADDKQRQLDGVRLDPTGTALTTQQGVRIDHTDDALTVGEPRTTSSLRPNRWRSTPPTSSPASTSPTIRCCSCATSPTWTPN